MPTGPFVDVKIEGGDTITESLISGVCKICQENRNIICCTDNKEALCPKEYNRGIFRKECIGYV